MGVKDDQLRRDYKITFSTPEGQAILRDLAQFCNVGLALHADTDPTIVYGVECMRKVFWRIYHQTYRPQPVRTKAPEFDFVTDPFKEIFP